MMKLHNRQYLRSFRKSNRKNLTPAEALLWKYLQKKQLEGRKFRRQHSIGPYIVDFYCAKEKLIVELDGEVHNNPAAEAKDEIRTKYLVDKGFIILRYENKIVFDLLPSVLNEIRDNFIE